MKKFLILLLTAAAMIFSSCAGNTFRVEGTITETDMTNGVVVVMTDLFTDEADTAHIVGMFRPGMELAAVAEHDAPVGPFLDAYLHPGREHDIPHPDDRPEIALGALVLRIHIKTGRSGVEYAAPQHEGQYQGSETGLPIPVPLYEPVFL